MDEETSHQMAVLAVENLADAVIMVDPQRRITAFNPAAERLTGYKRAEVLRRYCGDVLRGELCGERCPLLASIGQRRTVKDAESSIVTKDQRRVPVMISTSCLLGPEGELVGAVEVVKDLTEIKRAQRERQNLLSMLAHDMKSPVTVIEGFACRLLRKAELEEKVRRDLNIIREEAGRLGSFIGDFLQYSRLETGRVKPAFSACNLETEVCAALESLLPESKAKDVTVAFNAPASPLVLEADGELFRRALTNLVGNAVKFTEPGGRVTIEIVGQGEAAQVRVSDTGCGIAAEHLPFIFEPFNRGAASKPGTGLGLSIVQAIAEAHHGRVFVASEPGQGSTFTLVLPLKQPTGDRARPSGAQDGPDFGVGRPPISLAMRRPTGPASEGREMVGGAKELTIWEELRRVAKSRSKTCYEDVGQLVGLSVKRPEEVRALSNILRSICQYEVSKGRPMLCAVVTKKGGSLPGKKFFELARSLGRLTGDNEKAFFERELELVYETWQ